jgi:ABC-type multidrug transport system ATPase subunit
VNSWRKHKPEIPILKGISGHIEAGSLTAIVGPSGSGKTTLLNFLSGRLEGSEHLGFSFQYFINDTEVDSVSELKNIIGYVSQDDVIDGRMRPRTLLEFYGRLRGRRDFRQKAQQLINDLQLDHCANTLIGDSFNRGISGGERRRTSIGVELISDPMLLFLDEPTTGLDSTTALDVIRLLSSLKEKGITVVTTIHQPSEEIMRYFDNVFMLCDGHIIFDGTPDRISTTLADLNFKIESFETPIEYFMKVIDIDHIKIHLTKETGEVTEEIAKLLFKERIGHFLELLQRNDKNKIVFLDTNELKEDFTSIREYAKTINQKINVFRQISILLMNYLRLFFQDAFGVVVKSFIFCFAFAILVLAFVNISPIEDNPVAAIQDRMGLHYIFGMYLLFMGVNTSSPLLFQQIRIYNRDKQSGLYGTFAFYIANLVYVIPYFFVCISLGSVVMFYVMGLNNNLPSNFFWFFGFLFVGSFIGGLTLGMFVAVSVSRLELIAPMTSILTIPVFLVSGFFANIKTISWPLFLYSYISPLRFIFQGMTTVEFQNADLYIANCKVEVACASGVTGICFQPLPLEKAQYCDPHVFADYYEKDIWTNFVILVLVIFVWNCLALVVFSVKFRERTLKRSACKPLSREFFQTTDEKI